MLLIDDLLLWLPAKGLMGVFKKVDEMAKEELNNESSLKKELTKLQLQFDLGLVDEKAFQKKEDEILRKIDQLYKER